MSNNFKQLRIQPMTATPRDDVIQNIKEHLEIVPKWVSKFAPNNGTAHIVSAGPSMEKYIEQNPELKDENRALWINRDDKIWCVKHSIQRLVDIGVTPDYCVLLDGRDVEKESTHGVRRMSLIENAPKSTVFFVASMSNPIYTKYLLDKGYEVVGWHALTQEVKEFGNQIKYAISGGTCAAVRSLGIVHTLGFRKSIMYGVDSSLEGKPDVLPDKFMEVYVGNDGNKQGPIYTTGELIAQAQDIERLIQDETTDISVDIKCDGLMDSIFKKVENKTIKVDYRKGLGIN